MGTNYFVNISNTNIFFNQNLINIKEKTLHIGKSSAGWCFSLRIYPEKNINNLNDWKKILKNGKIIDEYDIFISYNKLIDIIENRSWNNLTKQDSGKYHEPGPNGLRRHKACNNESICIYNGEGTYDYIIGEFC